MSAAPPSVTARAHAKVILLGEHAVVYGTPALAAGLDRGASAEAHAAREHTLTLGERDVHPDGTDDVSRAYAAVLGDPRSAPLHIKVALDMPPGVGLGASAAIGVAISRVLFRSAHPQAGPDAEIQAALDATARWEAVFHGSASGVDAAAATHGGCLEFTRGHPVVQLHPRKSLNLAIAIAGPPAKTHEMVAGVQRIRQRNASAFEKNLDAIRSLVENAKLALTAGDIVGLGRLMDLNQMLLSSWFVSTESIETACRTARDAGALGAKLTGAGGGGCVIALIEEDPSRVLTAWRKAGFDCFATSIAATTARSEP